jgi:thiol-disulfide isomerase/thioredoxin
LENLRETAWEILAIFIMSDTSPSEPSTTVPTQSSAYRYLILAGLFMLVGISFLIYLGRERESFAGRQIPELDLKPLLNASESGSEAMEKAEYKLVHFWGTWCGPCVNEYPDIIKLQRKYLNDPRIAIVSISCGSKTPEALEELEFDTKIFVQGIGGDLPIYADPVMYSRIQVANVVGRQGFAYPTTLLLDKQMKIVDAWIGATGSGELDRAVSRILDKR